MVQDAYDIWSFQRQDIRSTKQQQSRMMPGTGMFEVKQFVI